MRNCLQTKKCFLSIPFIILISLLCIFPFFTINQIISFSYPIPSQNSSYEMNELRYSSYIGGKNNDFVLKSKIYNNSLFMVGRTESTDFPTSGALNSSYKGGVSDGFLMKFNSSSFVREWSICIGGSSTDQVNDISIGNDGKIYIVGQTSSTNLYILNGFQKTLNGSTDAFIICLNQNGTIEWSSYLGGTSVDRATTVCVDGENNIIISGETLSANFPVLNGFQMNKSGNYDLFISKFSNDGSLIWSSYYGGSGNEVSTSSEVDNDLNEIYIIGRTDSSNFPFLNGFQTQYSGFRSGFLLKLLSSGIPLYSSYIGGNGITEAFNLAITNDSIAIAGITQSFNFPLRKEIQNSFNGGSFDGFILELEKNGGLLLFSTYFGGLANDSITSISFDAKNSIIITGSTDSFNFPIKHPLYATLKSQSAFYAKIDPDRKLSVSTFIAGSEKDEGISIIASENMIFILGSTNSDDFPLKNPNQGTKAGLWDCFMTVLSIKIMYLPTAPVLILNSVNQSNGEINISWNAAENADYYLLYRTNGLLFNVQDLQPLKNTTTLSYQEKLTNGTYYYGIIAVNGSGNSDLSNLINVNIEISQKEEIKEEYTMNIFVFLFNGWFLMAIFIVGVSLILIGIKFRDKGYP